MATTRKGVRSGGYNFRITNAAVFEALVPARRQPRLRRREGQLLRSRLQVRDRRSPRPAQRRGVLQRHEGHAARTEPVLADLGRCTERSSTRPTPTILGFEAGRPLRPHRQLAARPSMSACWMLSTTMSSSTSRATARSVRKTCASPCRAFRKLTYGFGLLNDLDLGTAARWSRAPASSTATSSRTRTTTSATSIRPTWSMSNLTWNTPYRRLLGLALRQEPARRGAVLAATRRCPSAARSPAQCRTARTCRTAPRCRSIRTRRRHLPAAATGPHSSASSSRSTARDPPVLTKRKGQAFGPALFFFALAQKKRPPFPGAA